jgi:cellulose synthase/poly-beta-1,6-N-acetylglucosamine synthase-like glycosyltransferase
VIKENPFFSIVIPVKNEAVLLRHCLESLMKLDYPKDRFEIIVADGLSADDTKEVSRQYGARVVDNKKRIVVSGRNEGYRQAKGDIIAFTDADCTFDAGWLRSSLKYFSDDKVGGVGGVTFMPPDSSSFEKAIDFLFRLAEFFQTTSHRKNLSFVKEVEDIPGCNALYRRQALNAVMPVDEGLLTAEDVWMNFRVRKAGYKLIHAPDVMLWHYRRSSPKRFVRQIYRFAIGRMQVGRNNPALVNIFHLAIACAIPALLSCLAYFYLSGAMILCLKMFIFSLVFVILLFLLKTRSLTISVNMPFVLVLFVLAWSAGFLKELFFPLKDASGR